MKKLLFILFFGMVVLAGCGDKFSDDPLEVGSKNASANMIVHELEGEDFTVIDWYVTDDTDEDGFNTVDFEGYTVEYAITLVEDESGEEFLGVFAEVENGTNYDVQFNDNFLFLTDNGDQSHLEWGIRENSPGTKTKFFNHAILEYGAPEEMTAEISAPFRDGAHETIDIAEPIKLEFYKENN